MKGCTLCNHHFQLTTPFRFLFFKKLLKMKPFSCEAGYCFFLRPSLALFLLCFYVAFPGTPLRRDNVKPFAAVSEIFCTETCLGIPAGLFRVCFCSDQLQVPCTSLCGSLRHPHLPRIGESLGGLRRGFVQHCNRSLVSCFGSILCSMFITGTWVLGEVFC